MRRSLSNLWSDCLFLFGDSTRVPRLKSLSTGALDGVAAFFFREISFIVGNCFPRFGCSQVGHYFSFRSAKGIIRLLKAEKVKHTAGAWDTGILAACCTRPGRRMSLWHSAATIPLTISFFLWSLNHRNLNMGIVAAASIALLLSKTDANHVLTAYKKKKHIVTQILE